MKNLSLNEEYEAYLAIYKSMQTLPKDMRSERFNKYFMELDERLDELGNAIKYCIEKEKKDNIPYQSSELIN